MTPGIEGFTCCSQCEGMIIRFSGLVLDCELSLLVMSTSDIGDRRRAKRRQIEEIQKMGQTTQSSEFSRHQNALGVLPVGDKLSDSDIVFITCDESQPAVDSSA